MHTKFRVQHYVFWSCWKLYLDCPRVLVGTGRACFETLRPLAYSLLAEIVHHVRGDLSLSQVGQILLYSIGNIHRFRAHALLPYFLLKTRLLFIIFLSLVCWIFSRIVQLLCCLVLLICINWFAVITDYLPILKQHAWCLIDLKHSYYLCSLDVESGMPTE